MQRNRNIRKVIQEPKALEHNSNVYRRLLFKSGKNI